MNAPAIPAWHLRAACQYTDPEIFFPEADEGYDAAPDQADQARRVCLGCPVRTDCLRHALRRERWGVWGGLTERELAAERRHHPVRPAAEVLADADARYFARADRRTAKNARRLTADRRRRQEAGVAGTGIAA